MTFPEILSENTRRNTILDAAYDPLEALVEAPSDGPAREAWLRRQCESDFAFWAAYAVRIRDKMTGARVPFVLNRPQRRVLAVLEADRLAGRPIRAIMLKARQWGGSTLVQIYMAWIQMCHRTNWHSLVCAHVKDTAATIRGMYADMLATYPSDLIDADEDGKRLPQPEFKPYQRTLNTRVLAGRDCRVTIGSAERQDAIRGADIAMAHLSETAFWPSTNEHDPSDFVRAVYGSVPLAPYTLVVVESTANGVGNYFHTEWMRAREGRSDKHAIFVPWYEIGMYRLSASRDEMKALWESLTPYETDLWEVHGCSLEQINWYRHKLSEYPTRAEMMAEFPTTDTEAFVESGANVFANAAVESLRADCREPIAVGELKGDTFTADGRLGCLKVWAKPASGQQYVVAVDIGGRTSAADWSVAVVMTRGEHPEVVAQWRGHIDHDLLALRVIDLARHYNKALLIIESNTLESEDDRDAGSVLERVARKYSNTYRRRRDAFGGTSGIGFHTNRRTKPMVINTLIEAVRTHSYTERDTMACDELATYCRMPNGSYAARRGHHDDILMTRAIALHVIAERPCHTGFDTDLAALTRQPSW